MKKYFFALACLILLGACQKNENRTLINNHLSFSSYEEFEETRKIILNMTENERIAWESDNNFKSFATECQELFNELEQRSTLTDDDILSLVENNGDKFYLQDETDGKYLRAHLEDSYYYYVVNSDRIIQIADKIIKVFDEGLMIGRPEDIEIIKSTKTYKALKREHIEYRDAFRTQLPSREYECNCNRQETIARQTNNRNRTYIRVYVETDAPSSLYGNVSYCMTVRPYHRTAGIWYWCNRSITYNMTVRITNGQTFTRQKLSAPSTSSVEQVCFTTISSENILTSGFTNINGWGKTPDAECPVSCSMYP